ncbi:developmental pluripotency-associated protein 2 [Orycteropus afer afer]|uniref:Developmental pluripotency-associated protein 2 n=1 Tax=Orycteropus afer afer TaxID=1230840 RepID=A0A8B7A9W7_ORYAF|nr:developmental pluripotency-associated protein 2 [Orycteropus afer afer]
MDSLAPLTAELRSMSSDEPAFTVCKTGGLQIAFDSDLDEDSLIITLVPVKEEPNQEHQIQPSASSMAEVKQKRPRRNNKGHLPQMNGQLQASPKPRPKIPVLPMPTILPPVNEVHRDTLRNWCQQVNLSTDGQKVDVYLRLQKHAYPDQKQDIPNTPKEAKLQSCLKKRKTKKAKLQESSKTTETEEVTNIVEVISSAQEAMLASWARISSRALQPKAVNSYHIPASPENFLLQGSGKINLKG